MKKEFLVGDATVHDRSLTLFVERYSHSTRLYPGDAGEFVSELLRRWRERRPEGVKTATTIQEPLTASGPGLIFLSYAHEDIAAAGVTYRRGDETGEMQIVHSIWEEICRATHVIVDLTGLNANVCLELAFAQALGRRTLLVARDQGTVEHLFPEISKLQVRYYGDSASGGSLAEIARDFLASAS